MKTKKQSTNQAPSAAEIAAVPAKAKKQPKAKAPKAARVQPSYTLRSTKGAEDLAPQAQCILKALAKLGKKADRPTLVGALASKGGLVTRQTPSYIFTFYRRTLLDGGYMAEHAA